MNVEFVATLKGKKMKEKKLFQAINSKMNELKKNNYIFFKNKVNKFWFEEIIINQIKYKVEIEVEYEYIEIESSNNIRITVIGDKKTLLSFIFPKSKSFSITTDNKILD